MVLRNLFIISQVIFFYTFSNAQGLAAEFNAVSSANDMMGGALVVFCGDGITASIPLGKSDFSRDINTTKDTKYRIASISKTVTAIALMQLVEQDLLDLDEDISEILGYPVQNPAYPEVAITSRMLLSHRSSIIDGSTYSSFLGASVNNNPIPNLSELLSPSGAYYAADQFNSVEPGTYFNYSNANYVILGTIIEKVADTRFDVYCKQNISTPLGIDASFNVNDLDDIDQLAVLYRKVNGNWVAQADNYQGVQPVFNNLGDYVAGTNGARFGPQGGFRCSAEDLAKLFLVLMNGGTYDGISLLSSNSCEAMFADEWTYNGSNGNDYYGLFRSWGLGVHRITSSPGNDLALPGSSSLLGHPGEAYGLVSDAYFDIERNVGFVFLTNGVGTGYQTNSNSVFYTVEQEVFNAIEEEGNIGDCQQVLYADELKEGSVILYPNPATDSIYFPVNLKFEQEMISIVTLDFKIVKRVSVAEGNAVIDISDLKAGIYYILSDQGVFKFIKA